MCRQYEDPYKLEEKLKEELKEYPENEELAAAIYDLGQRLDLALDDDEAEVSGCV